MSKKFSSGKINPKQTNKQTNKSPLLTKPPGQALGWLELCQGISDFSPNPQPAASL